MSLTVKALVNGRWQVIETIRAAEVGSEFAMHKAARGLAKATRQFPNVTAVIIEKN